MTAAVRTLARVQAPSRPGDVERRASPV